MATVSKGRTFVSGETVTPAKLNELVDNATVTGVVNADVSASAAIDGSKISPTFASPLKVTQAGGPQYVLIGNQDSGGANNPAIICSANGALQFGGGTSWEGSGGTFTPVVTVSDNSRVGIGETNPAEQLHIAQNFRIGSSVMQTPLGSAPLFACRAWVNFDGTSVTNVGGEDRCTVRESGNVSKVVRSANGRYTIHFSTAMPDANYCAIFTGNGGSDTFGVGSRQFFVVRTRAAGSVQVNCIDDAGSSETNPQYVGVAIFR